MKTIHVKNFYGGMTRDLYSGNIGEFSTSRQFDILSYPYRLFPLPSMSDSAQTTKIGNMITASDGVVYGSGGGANDLTKGSIWKTTDGTWTELTLARSGQAIDYNLLIEYKENHATRTILYSGSGGIYSIDPANAVGNDTHSLTYTSMSQAIIHPKDNIMYFGYTNSSGTFIGLNNAGSWNNTALQLPSKYTITSLAPYGNYLAIACTSYSIGVVPGSGINTSVVYLWDRDTSLATVSEVISWGDDSLHVLNNLNGILIGVSKLESNTHGSLLIKGYSGQIVPEVLKEIFIRKETTTAPSIIINSRVNLIHRNRLMFSVDLKGGGTSPVEQGLWALGKNKNGQWVVYPERFGSSSGEDVSIICATYRLDYLFCAHTEEGTLTFAKSGSDTSTDYTGASIYESLVNPEMGTDRVFNKQLFTVALHFLPLQSGAQAIIEYRVDGSDWQEILTETTAGKTVSERTKDSNNTAFTAGRNYEFRISSVGGANITGFSYKYDILSTNLLP